MTRYNVCSINVGKPMVMETSHGEVETAFQKKPVDEPVYLGELHFDGDEQADKKHHGGPDRAVCLYPADHYPYWGEKYGKEFTFPSFGENLSVAGIDEDALCIGDVFQLGEARLQVTEPRQPCYKIARTHELDDFPAQVMKTGFTGCYLRVLEPGQVKPGDDLKRIESDARQVTITEVNDVKYHDRDNKDKIKRILECEALAAGLRQSLEKKLVTYD
ncbi:MOSC domain-containing protein [Thalassobacillus hwangdonensis]|uniref:MOSC domain-containing protein n=1 Tax=Thalassobacillus hwangdonensis TaxID=546108 RepID=A0ABW3L7Q2_9BACI